MYGSRALDTKLMMLIWTQLSQLRPIPTRPIWSPPTAIVGRLESADWVGVKILNIFDMESRPTVVKSANSGIELADSTTDSAIIPLKIGLWVWAFIGGAAVGSDCYQLGSDCSSTW